MKRISAQAVLRFIDRVEQEKVNLHGFELSHHDQIRAEGYYAPFGEGQPHRMYSVSKSMVSLAIGILYKEGKLTLEDPIVRYFPDKLPDRPDERLLRLTIRDMLRMATCHRKTTYREGIDCDWCSTFFTVKPTHEPGTVFHYDTSCSQVLAALVERLSGMNLLAFLEKRVFSPIGANDPKRWLNDPSGVPQGGTGLLMSLRDLGKTARLIMSGGGGILSADYLSEATSYQIATPFQGNPEEKYGYGWQFWRTRDGWSMYGLGGQLAIAHPKSGILLCTIADTRLDPFGVQRIYNAFFDEIIHAEVISESAADEERLQDRLNRLHVMGVSHQPYALHEGEFCIEPNEAGLKAVSLHSKTVRLTWAHGVHCFEWKQEGAVHEIVFTNQPALLSAGMQDENTLRVQCHLIGDAPCGMDLLFSERQGHLTAVFKRSSDPATVGYDGVFYGTRIQADA